MTTAQLQSVGKDFKNLARSRRDGADKPPVYALRPELTAGGATVVVAHRQLTAWPDPRTHGVISFDRRSASHR